MYNQKYLFIIELDETKFLNIFTLLDEYLVIYVLLAEHISRMFSMDMHGYIMHVSWIHEYAWIHYACIMDT